ncbi:hypothetical protein IWW38_004705, partial [Coemansia aciculifera]
MSSSPSSKRLELQIALLEDPVVVRDGQGVTVIRGYVTVTSRQVQPVCQIHVLLLGTKILLNTQQMGGTGSAKRTLLKETKVLSHNSGDVGLSYSAMATYTLPFEFVVNSRKLSPTLRLPRCTVGYTILATALKCESAPPLLRLFSPKPPKAQVDVVVVKYPAGGGSDPADLLARLRPVTRVGTLGAYKNGRGSLPYRISMDKNVVAPGDTLRFKLDIYQTGSVPPDFTPAEFAALIDLASTHDQRAATRHDSGIAVSSLPTGMTNSSSSNTADDDDNDNDSTTSLCGLA